MTEASFRHARLTGFTFHYTAAMNYDSNVGTLSEWRKGWEPVRTLEEEISQTWVRLRALRVEVEEVKAHLIRTCPDPSLSEEEILFWRRVRIINDETSCWEWAKSRRNIPGEEYGTVRWTDPLTNKSTVTSPHRIALYFKTGEVPDHARHTCDNPPCCRPSHLINGTHADNMADKKARGRGRGKTSQRGEANDSSVLTDQIVVEARDLARAGATQSSLATKFGVSRDVLGYALRGQTWTHLDSVCSPVRLRPGGSRLTEEDIRAIRTRRGQGERLKVIAEEYGLTISSISLIARGLTGGHLTS